HLPPPLHEGFDAVVRAFHESEAGRDEAAREALQRIGLQSPFLEWKLLVRGLIAYYQQDDVRALDNWQRLDKDRLPARLAAPVRFQIDRAFRDACTPEMTATLQRATVQLQGTSASQPLRAIQAALANSHSLDEALRLAPNAIAMLQQQAPKLVARLASCYYWAIVQHGIPPQVGRYQRLFGATPDDPQLNRMHALQFERLGDLKEAHEYWRHFDEDVCRNPHVWTGGAGGGADATVNRVRALIWARMGNNAATIPELDKLPIQLPPFLANHPGRPRLLSPGPEACFRRSLELAPDRLESYMDLLEYHE